LQIMMVELVNLSGGSPADGCWLSLWNAEGEPQSDPNLLLCSGKSVKKMWSRFKRFWCRQATQSHEIHQSILLQSSIIRWLLEPLSQGIIFIGWSFWCHQASTGDFTPTEVTTYPQGHLS
jgi:hypothetical protein